ncbi:MAG: hypothetical protein HYZ85_02990 [Candidatus Omnitrophica bacterium]|nr:hypothetical protein [Candidatus Omnitrophota bacterium]
MKKNTQDFVKMIERQDAGDADGSSQLVAQFEGSMEQIAVSRFRICLSIFLILFPLISMIDYFSSSFQNPSRVMTLTALMEVTLLIYLGLTFVHQFRKDIYAFAFVLACFIGVYNLGIILLGGQAARDQYVIYALIF